MLGQNLEHLVLAERGAHDESGLHEPAQAVGPAVGGRREGLALPEQQHPLGRRRHRPCEGAGGLEVRRPESAPSGEGHEAEGADRTPLDLEGHHHERADPLGGRGLHRG